MNIIIFFREKISDLYIIENRVCVNLWLMGKTTKAKCY